MAVENITISQFLSLEGRYPVLDVRSPGEFQQAHLPGAYNLPLFTDEERKVVGTAYKKESKQQAIKKGLQYFGPKMVQMVEEAEGIVRLHHDADTKESTTPPAVVVHCWRGGMRSAGVAWLLNLYGFKVYTITGGYKSFRRWCAVQFAQAYPFAIIGGYTGSGKTAMLKALHEKGHAVIDLEALACHKGSAFGSLGQTTQPTQEMFENRLALALADASGATAGTGANRIWLEDESQRIGGVTIPPVLYRYIQQMPVYFFDIPFEARLQYIVEGYGTFGKDLLAAAITRIRKRLGGLETKTALQLLEQGDVPGCFLILLKYYDRHYLKCLHKKNTIAHIRYISTETTDAAANAAAVEQQPQMAVQ